MIHLRRKNPMKIGMLENTSIISKLIDVKVVTRSRQTSERPISDYYYIIFIRSSY